MNIRLATLTFVGVTMIVATTAAAAPEEVRDSTAFWTAIVAGEMVLLLAALGFARKIVFTLVDERLHAPGSALSEHMKDADAHEKMRRQLSTELTAEIRCVLEPLMKAHSDTREDTRSALELARVAIEAMRPHQPPAPMVNISRDGRQS